MTTPERGRDGLREAIEALAAKCAEWAESHHASAVTMGYPDADDGDMDAGLADAFNHCLAELRRILAEHPATGDEEPYVTAVRDGSPLPIYFTPPASDVDSETYCGAELGEVRTGECECPRCASHPDPLQDWPMPGHLRPDADVDSDNAAAGGAEGLADSVYRTGLVNLPLADSLDVDCHDVARAVLASDWLAAHDAKARADERERIAQAIQRAKAAAPHPRLHPGGRGLRHGCPDCPR